MESDVRGNVCPSPGVLAQVGCEESLLRQWLEVCVSEGGVLVAQQRLTKKPLAVAQMTEEWLNHYRRLA